MKRLPYFLAVFTVWIALAVVSCSPFEPSLRETPEELVPDGFAGRHADGEPLNRWWDSFGDTQLTSLVEEALGGNFSLKVSWARLEQARALAVQKGGPLTPDLTFAAGASAGRQATEITTDTVESYSLGLTSRYEIDLWGRVRSEQQAATFAVAATREDVSAAATTLAANITTRWIGVVSQRMQKNLLLEQLRINETLQELVELRFRKSLATALDVFQQRQLVEGSRAQLPLVEQTERQLLHELALLLGRMPFSAPSITATELSIPADLPSAGIPVMLLKRRPDIRAAMRRLEAADWNVSAARADRLPSISLTARAAYQDDEWRLLFDNWILNLAGNLTAPLLDGGIRKAEVRRQVAIVEENIAAYSQLVLSAMREVEDALVSEQKLREFLDGQNNQLKAAQNALNEARLRYRSGLSDYLPVLTQLLVVQELERNRIQRQAELLVARVTLYRALGGSWTDRLTPSVLQSSR
jgi:multidrug efflux system outer membrane protein